MATASEPAEELVKCSICFEVFKTPKYLPCLHTFCESCLDTYITSLFQKEQNMTGFNCPVCRAPVSGPENKKAGEWAKNFPINHLIVSLIDHKEKDSGKSCDECLRDNAEVKAESLCLECSEMLCVMCTKSHRRNKVTKVHQVVNLDELTDENMPILTTPRMYCKEHSDRKLEVYCADHDIACCFLCMSLRHRKCDQIISLEEASNDIREKKAPILKTKIAETGKSLTTVSEAKQRNIKEFDTQCSDIRTNLSAVKKELVDHIVELETSKNKELEKLYQIHMSKMKNEEENCNVHSSKLASCEKSLTSCISHGSNVHVVLEYNRIKNLHQEIAKEMETRIHAMEAGVNIKFAVNSKLKEMLTSIGSLIVENQKSDIDFQKANPVLESTLDLKGNALGCEFVGDTIIFTDLIAPRCFVYDILKRSLTELKLPGNSYDIASIDSKQAVVTMKFDSTIQYIDTENMSLSSTVKLEGNCMGICKYKDKIVLAFAKELALFDSNWQKIKTIALSRSCGDRSVCSTADSILYTNYTSNSVHCIDESGTELFHYKHDKLKGPLGITTDCRGNIYVAGWHSNNIHQVTPVGKHCRILLADIKEPWGLAFKKDSNMFIVTFQSGKSAKIFRFE